MPPPPGGKKKKKGRAPKHQNTFAFRHNAKSKKTEKILSSPNVGVCRRCWEKIEWRKKYRKYKPRTQPGKCNLCSNRNVMAAYHTICTKCAVSDAAIVAMEKHQGTTELVQKEGTEETLNLNADGQDEDPAESSTTEDVKETPNLPVKSKRKIKVCAMCTHEPALSKYDNMPEEAGELISQIHELEDTLESGIDEKDGHKLTLREVKAIERQLEKLKLEVKEFGRKKTEGESEEGAEQEEENNDDDSEGDNICDEENYGEEASGSDESDNLEEEDEEDDPFLKAVGGKDKLLVGEDYQKMLLAKAEARKSG